MRNDVDVCTEAISRIRQSPEAVCVRAVHTFGTVWVRFDDDACRWRALVFRPGYGDYVPNTFTGKQLFTLLRESEFSLHSRGDYPEGDTE